MSYEGYSQFLCKEGHYWEVDCYNMPFDKSLVGCPVCFTPAVWENMVDTTNGSFEDSDYYDDESHKKQIRIDGYIELEVLSEEKCDKCGHIIEKKYKIPEKKQDE